VATASAPEKRQRSSQQRRAGEQTPAGTIADHSADAAQLDRQRRQYAGREIEQHAGRRRQQQVLPEAHGGYSIPRLFKAMQVTAKRKGTAETILRMFFMVARVA
jgi:hypothetical protein